MRELIDRALCAVGLHRWWIVAGSRDTFRECLRCHRVQMLMDNTGMCQQWRDVEVR